MPDDPLAAAELEAAAAAVHQAYLDTCARLGWPVKPANQVPYEELPEDAKELDRASVRAVAPLIAARIRAAEREGIAEHLSNLGNLAASEGRRTHAREMHAAAAIARAHRTTPTEEPTDE